VRPQAEALLTRLATGGRLSVGPWYTLPDEFLVSGETLVRNLQLGLERAAEFGGAMEVGYLPDTFGHVAQMPQLLRQFGLDHAVVWRGVPAAVNRTAFWWTAPDGSTVRAEYLAAGYSNGASIPDDACALVRRIAAHEGELGELLAGPLLFMNGSDHHVPQPWLGRVVAEANEAQDDYDIVVSSLPDHLAAAPTEGLAAWTGELRSGARANLLAGVASNRVDVKQAAARAERALERVAEPLCALFLPASRWPRAELALAWREVLRNAAHDSVCACSADTVVAAVLHRYVEASQIGDGLAARALKTLGASLAQPGLAAVNPSPRPRGGVVELVVAGNRAPVGSQVLDSRPGGPEDVRWTRAADVAALLGQIRGSRLDDTTFVRAIDVEEDGDGIQVVLRTMTSAPEGSGVEEARRRVYAVLSEKRQAWYRVRIERTPELRLLARVENVPGYGWTTWLPAPLAVPPVTVEGTTMANGRVTVEVDPATGTFSIDGLAGLDRLVDQGDQGDTYTYCPPLLDHVVDEPTEVDVEILEAGPVRAALTVRRSYDWPEGVDDASGARVGWRRTVVTTRLEVCAGERFVRVTTSFENRSRDHRLRASFPLPTTAATSRAECAFAVVERGLEAEGGPSERALATFPSRRFVSAGGLTVAHEGLLEYEVVDGGRVLALTLLRATGVISRGPMPARTEPAGPPVPVPGAQMLGPVVVRYAVQFGDDDPYALVDDAFLPLAVVTAPGGGRLPASGSALVVEGAEVSAVTRGQGGLEVRVFNPMPAPTTVRLEGRSGCLVDLRGRPVAPFSDTFDIGPWRIASARLAE
jgi:mannosylglycerate hydrolase